MTFNVVVVVVVIVGCNNDWRLISRRRRVAIALFFE
jgi:hypothetical protein